MTKNAFIDLDGTLLNSIAKITKQSLESVKKLVNQDTNITICTGRWPISAIAYNDILNKYCSIQNKYLISMNGSLIFNLKENKIINSFFVEDDILKKLFLIQKKYKIAIWVYNKRGIENKIIYCNGIPLKLIVGYFNYGKLKKIKYNNFSFQNDTYKVLYLSFNKKKIQRLYNWLNDNLSNYINIIKVSKYAIEIVSKNSSKGNAILKLAKDEKINLKNCYAFGDSNNDLTMFNVVGNSFSINSKSLSLKNISSDCFFGKHAFSESIEDGIINKKNIINVDFDKLNSIPKNDNMKYMISINKKFNEFSKEDIKEINKYNISDFNLIYNDGYSIDKNFNIIKSSFINKEVFLYLKKIFLKSQAKISIVYIKNEKIKFKSKSIKLSKNMLFRSMNIYSIEINNYNINILEDINKFKLNIIYQDENKIILK